MRPIELGPNQPETFYRGSGRLAAFRGLDLPPRPEDWLASTTPRFGLEPAGLSRLPDQTLFAEAVAADPIGWLGGEHVACFGADPNLLVKLLDAGQRLPVHVHPSRSFSLAHLASPYGKTEAWIVLDARPDASVWLGFARDVAADELAGWVTAQDVGALLAATNEVPVRAGDAILCPAGLPHAIGPDILLVELQEPSDFSVLLEWDGFGLSAADATLGLPMEQALECVDRRACDPARLAALRGPAGGASELDRSGGTGSLLPAEANGYFRADRLSARTDGVGTGALRVPAGFAVLVVSRGSGRLTGAWGSLEVSRGSTIAIPAGADPCELTGDVGAVLCRPPLPF